MRYLLGKTAIATIGRAIDSLFNRAKARLLGRQYGPKQLAIRVTTEPLGHRHDYSIPGLFDSSSLAEGAQPRDDLREHLVSTAESYLDATKAKAKAQVINAVKSFITDAELHGRKVDPQVVLGGELAEVMKKVTANVKMIAATEATRTRNVGTLDAITKTNTLVGVSDPNVYFVVVRDVLCCEECKRIHVMPDGITPRVYKLSEVSAGYHKRGTDTPCISGLHPHCLTANMRLHTDLGMKTLGELFRKGGGVSVVVDSRVKNRKVPNNQFGKEITGSTWYHRHSSGARILPATNVFDTGVQKCYRVTLASGHSLEVSEGHEWWVDNDNGAKQVRTSDLKVGDKVPLLSGEGGWGVDHFPELAELMGNLMGDGCLVGDLAQWNFFGNDIEYGRVLLGFAKKYSKWMRDDVSVIPPDEKYSVCRSGIHSNILGRIFVSEFGLSKKPRRIPVRLWSADKETVAAFLRGLYAADGHSEDGPTVSLAQNDKEFLEEAQVLLANFGIRSNLFTHGTETVEKAIIYANGDVYQTTRKPCWRLHIGGWGQVNEFAEQIGFGVPFKQAALLSRLEAKSGLKQHGGWRTARVEKIEPIGEQQTYCLTEPMTNTITVNGVITKNCRCSLVTCMPGYGFDASGKITYITHGYDVLKAQRG